MWKKSIKYFGVQLDRRLSFGEHLQITTAKAIQCGTNLARLMPNIGEPREAKIRMVANVVHPKLLYAARSGQVPLATMLFKKSCSRHKEE